MDERYGVIRTYIEGKMFCEITLEEAFCTMYIIYNRSVCYQVWYDVFFVCFVKEALQFVLLEKHYGLTSDLLWGLPFVTSCS
jgi:hypothetical protein